MNTATTLRTIQAAADRCTFRHGAHVTASIIDDAARLSLTDAELAQALNSGFIPSPAPVALMDSPSVKSLIRAAKLSDVERALVAHKIASNEVATPAELRAYLQELARARVAARCAKLAPLPASELADVAALAGNLARAERAAQVAEANHAIHIGAEIVTAKPAEVVTASPVEEIPAQAPDNDPNIIPNNDDLQDDPDRTLDLPASAPDFHIPASRPDLEVYRPTWPALPGQPAKAAPQGKLARAKSALADAERKVASKGLAERTVVVAGDLAWVESSDGQSRYRVEFEGGIPVHCGCRDPRASFGGCKHADAAHECRQQGDGTYKGTVNPKPNPSARRQHQPSL